MIAEASRRQDRKPHLHLMIYGQTTAFSFMGWLRSALLLCVCLAMAARPVTALTLMHDHRDCEPVATTAAAHSHSASHDHDGAHASSDAHDHSEHHHGSAPEAPQADKHHAASATSCCGMLCAAAMPPAHMTAGGRTWLPPSTVAETDQFRGDPMASRLFRPPRMSRPLA